MNKILLVSPPFYRLMGSHYNGPHLGLSYISSYLDKFGIKNDILNLDYLPVDEYLDQIELLDGYDDYKSIMNNPNHNIWDICVDKIVASDSDVVGFTMFTANIPAVQIISKLLKQRKPNIKIIIGGPNVSINATSSMITISNADYAIRGEGEETLLEFMSGELLSSIKGLIYRDSSNETNRLKINPQRDFIEDLDKLPYPNRGRIDLSGNPIGGNYIITSRGCPFRCSFCASPTIWQNRVRTRSVNNIMDELVHLKMLGNEFVQFKDDTLTMDKNRIMHLLNEMIRSNIDMEWVCDTRLNSLDIELLQRMRTAGCRRVKVGIESGSDEILKKIHKGITVQSIKDKIRLIKTANIDITAYFMIGFPGETDRNVEATIQLAKDIDIDYYSLSTVAPYYGTEIYDPILFDKVKWECFFHQSKDMIMNTKISKEVIEKFWELNKIGKGKRL